MSTLYRKTDQGRQEIETRAHRLPARLRSLLIMIDGKRDRDALQALLSGDLDAHLRALLDGGFIEVRQVRPTVDPSQALEQRKQLVVRHLTDRLGPLADPAAMRVEAARSPSDLSSALEQAEKLLRQAAGTSAGNTFRALFIDPPLT
jgi:hypothetical protein